MVDSQQAQTEVIQLALEQFPILVSGARPGRAESFEKAIAAVNDGLAHGEIYNPVFNDAKDRINRTVDEAYDRHVKDRFVHYDQPKDVQELSWSFMIMGLHDCKAAGKKIRATKAVGPMVDAMREFIDEVEPLWKAMDAVKPLVVKRRVLTPEERAEKERYLPPATSLNGIAEMRAALEGVTQKKFDELVALFDKSFHSNVAAFEAATPEKRAEIIKDPFDRAGIFEGGEGGFDKKPYVRKVNFAQIINELAVKRAKEIQDSFVFKNLRKLCSIVEAKGDFDRVEECGSSVSLSGLEGTFRLTFKDGASFIASNSVVYSRSVYNTPFVRYPLTFHDVVMGNGAKMPKPSEERMNTVFAVAPAPAPAQDVGGAAEMAPSKGAAGPGLG
jgi:hypothetical protein